MKIPSTGCIPDHDLVPPEKRRFAEDYDVVYEEKPHCPFCNDPMDEENTVKLILGYYICRLCYESPDDTIEDLFERMNRLTKKK